MGHQEAAAVLRRQEVGHLVCFIPKSPSLQEGPNFLCHLSFLGSLLVFYPPDHSISWTQISGHPPTTTTTHTYHM